MGGKLFNLPRMPRDEYLAREAEVRACLDRLLAGQYRIPRFYGDKRDFGDMDVIVAAHPDWEPAVRPAVLRELGITEVKPTGHVYSTVYRGLQTDFFAVEPRYLDSMYVFMSFNDLGNFIGKICRRFDLKYGEKGLAYVFRRDDGHYKADLPITQDFARVCAFLGLDHAHWARGFGSLPEMFDWVIASPYFSVAPYLDDEREGARDGAAGRGHMAERKIERTTVARFVEYLRDKQVDKRPEFEDRRAYLPRVVAAFPEVDLPGQIAREQQAEARGRAFSAKFNGKKVMRLVPGLDGRALGEFIVAFKSAVPDFEAFVLATPEEELDRRIVEFAARRT